MIRLLDLLGRALQIALPFVIVWGLVAGVKVQHRAEARSAHNQACFDTEAPCRPFQQ
jgi:hypothetical protein